MNKTNNAIERASEPEIIEVTQEGIKKIILKREGFYIVKLLVPGAEVNICGHFHLRKHEKKNVSVIIHHQAPHTKATTTLKAVAQGKSSVSLLGKIVIDKNCNDSQSFLTERVLLLDQLAQAKAVPELEILSDEVKCSHAASVSNMNEEQMFYLQSRGLSRTQAKNLLIKSFLA